MATASLAFIVRQIDARLAIPLQRLKNLICLLPKPDGPPVGQLPCRCDPCLVGIILGESTASVYWDLQKFYDSIGVRHLIRLGEECGFPLRVASGLPAVFWLRALRWAGYKQHTDGWQVLQCIREKHVVWNLGGGLQDGAFGQDRPERG